MAARFADAENVEALWDNILERRTAFGAVPKDRWDHSAFLSDRSRDDDKTYVEKGAFIDGIDEFAAFHFGIAPRRVQVMDPQHRLVLETARQALEDAGWSRDGFDPEMMGTFLGVSTSEYRNLVTSRSMGVMMATGQLAEGLDDEAVRGIAKSVERVTPISAFSMPGTLLNMVAANVAAHWGLGGPAFTLDAACASSLVAVHEAVTNIRAGICNTALAGGVYLNLTPETMIGFSRIGAISRSGDCRPFDAKADGFLQGDGCGVVVLKSFDQAVRDGDRIYGVIRGVGMNNDAGRAGGPMAPSLEGQQRAVERAWRDAKLPASKVGFVACHGTATPVGDPVEVGALRHVFGDEGEPVHLGSIKANVGHTMSAAGVAGLIHATLAVYHGVIPPQASFDEPHEALELEGSRFAIPTETKPWSGERIAAVSAFGFGGTNAHVVVESYEQPATTAADGPELVVLSAGSQTLLAQHARLVAKAVRDQGLSLADVAHTLSQTRAWEASRLSIVATSADDLATKLDSSAELLDAGTTGLLGPDMFAADATAALASAWLFPGQGAQRLGLCRDLYERFPSFRAHFDRLSSAAESVVGTTLTELLFADGEQAADRLTATEHCQPVMAALGLALAGWLRDDFGAAPTATMGHSLGEFAAAAAAGVLTDEAAVSFVAQRGRLMADMQTDDFGKMAAVRADASSIAELVERSGAVLANLNRSDQTVISGTSEAVDSASDALRDAGFDVTELRVSHAFHSPVVEPVAAPLRKVIAELIISAPNATFVSATRGAVLESEDQIRAAFGDHATAPVDFVAALQAMPEVGVAVEMGAGTTLSRFAADVRPEVPTVSLAGREPDDSRTFLRALGQLAALGALPHVDGIRREGRRVVSLPATPLETQSYWIYRDRLTPLEIGEIEPAPKRAEAKQEATMANDELVALFREQMSVLNRQVEIIAAQNQALGLEGVDVSALQSALQSQSVPAEPAPVAAETPAPAPAPEPEEEVAEEAGPSLKEVVLDAVAAVSAFPRTSLKTSQQLAADLGFDSLMFVDLGTALQKALPSLGAIPQEAFHQRTTVGDVVNVLEDIFAKDRAGAEEAAEHVTTELQRFRPVLVPRQAPALPARPFQVDGKLLFATTGGPRSASIAEELQHRGMFAQVELSDLETLRAEAKNARGVVVLIDESLPTPPALSLHALARDLEDPKFFVVVTNGAAPAEQASAVSGFAKSLAREWSDVFVKAIELDDDSPTAALFAELDGPSRDVDVALLHGERHVSSLEEEPFGEDSLVVDSNDTIAITGGGRGIGAKVARWLADKTQCGLVLIGRTPMDKLGPETIETLEACSNLGSNVRYLEWDITEVRADAFEGLPVNGLIHSAGVIADASVREKTTDQIERVTSVKVDGLRNVLSALIDRDMKLLVGFSSWAGHFGNRGQTDYAAANAAVDAMFAMLSDSDVDKVVSIGWPGWESTEMVQSIPAPVRKAMKAEGVTFISDEVGLEAFGRELATKSNGVVIYGDDLPTSQRHVRATVSLSLESHPYLDDHRLRGKALLPFAAALDYAAVTAGSEYPLRFTGVNLFRGVELDEPTDIEVELHTSDERAKFELAIRADDSRLIAYRGTLDSVDQSDLENIPKATSNDDLPFDLPEFYESYSFHGPLMQGVSQITSFNDQQISGVLASSKPQRWVAAPSRGDWTVDPLVVDSAFQLVAYWLAAKKRKSGFPLSIGSFDILEPFTADSYEVTIELAGNGSDDQLVGTFVFRDGDRVVARMNDVVAQLIDLTTEVDDDAPEEFDPESWDIARFPEVEALAQRLEMADLIGVRNPYFHPHDGPARNVAMIEGREMINFSSYNYLGFSGDPDVSEAAKGAVDRFGTSVSASRLASGQIPLHEELEAELADLVGVGGALVFSAGHATNESVIGHLFNEGDLIITDSLAHNSILTGAELSGAKRLNFPHNDYQALERMLKELRRNFRKVGVFIEGVYSMDGDIPNLPEFIRIRNKYKVLLYVDEAHSMGCIGDGGRGISRYYDIDPTEVDVWMGTLSKSFASCGGYVAGSRELIEYLKYTAPGFIFSAGISPANTAAALASIRKMKANPEIAGQLQERSKFFLEACKERGLDTGMSKDSAVVPVIVGNSLDCLHLSQNLADRGINVQPIVYPAVDDESSRLRFFLSSTHTEEQLARTAEICAEELANVRSGAAAE